jgi:hypothetical protein
VLSTSPITGVTGTTSRANRRPTSRPVTPSPKDPNAAADFLGSTRQSKRDGRCGRSPLERAAIGTIARLDARTNRKRSTISPDDLLHRAAPSIAPTLIAQARYLPVALLATSPPFCRLRITSV